MEKKSPWCRHYDQRTWPVASGAMRGCYGAETSKAELKDGREAGSKWLQVRQWDRQTVRTNYSKPGLPCMLHVAATQN